MESAYKLIDNAFLNPSKEEKHTRLISWRAGDSIVKLEKPSRLGKARMLGYKAKKGIVVFRVRLLRGGRKRPRHTHGRKSRKQHVRKVLKMSYRWISEIRAERTYPNLEVLNSYPIGKDGKYYYFEVIMIDPSREEIKNDSVLRWIVKERNRNRAQRGLTSAGKKSRGLRSKNRNMKVRPSLRAWNRQGK